MFSACWRWLISGNSSVRSLLWISEFVLPVFIIDVLDLISFNKRLSFALLFVSEIWGSPLPHILEQDEATAMIQADNENFKWCQLVVSFLKRTGKLKPWLTPEYEPLSIKTCPVMRTRLESVVLGDAVPPGCQVLRSLLHLWPVWAGWACNQLEADLLQRLSPATELTSSSSSKKKRGAQQHLLCLFRTVCCCRSPAHFRCCRCSAPHLPSIFVQATTLNHPTQPPEWSRLRHHPALWFHLLCWPLVWPPERSPLCWLTSEKVHPPCFTSSGVLMPPLALSQANLLTYHPCSMDLFCSLFLFWFQ